MKVEDKMLVGKSNSPTLGALEICYISLSVASNEWVVMSRRKI